MTIDLHRYTVTKIMTTIAATMKKSIVIDVTKSLLAPIHGRFFTDHFLLWVGKGQSSGRIEAAFD